MSFAQAAQRAQAWLSPLPGASPFGVDVRSEPEHAAIRAEVQKLDSPAAASQVDWKRVADDGSALLASRSKDFLIAAYTAHALHEQESLAGLFAGIALLHGLLEHAWEGMFPPPSRIKGRVAALQWFVERASVRLSASAAGAAHAAADIDALRDAAQKLGELARARFGDDTPAMQPLLAALERLRLDATAGGAGGGDVAVAAAETAAQAAPQVDGAAVLEAALASADEAPPTQEAAIDAADAPLAASADPEAAARAALRTAIAAWLEPIAEDARAGKDARYDPLHEEVRAMIKLLDSPSGQPPEWKKLVSHSEVLLKQRGKDLLIASYAAYGLHQEQSLTGLADGLALVAGLLDEYWEDLFPDMKRSQKARAGALSWLLARLGTLGERALGAGEAEAVPRLSAAARWLAEVVSARFDDEHRPALRPFLEQIERLELAAQPASEAPAAATHAPQRAPAAQGAPAAGTAPRAVAAAVAVPQAAAAPAEVANRAEVARYLAGLHTALVDMGRALRKANPKDPLAYLLPRIGAALELDEVPPSNDGRTFISAPNPMELQEIHELRARAGLGVPADRCRRRGPQSHLHLRYAAAGAHRAQAAGRRLRSLRAGRRRRTRGAAAAVAGPARTRVRQRHALRRCRHAGVDPQGYLGRRAGRFGVSERGQRARRRCVGLGARARAIRKHGRGAVCVRCAAARRAQRSRPL